MNNDINKFWKSLIKKPRKGTIIINGVHYQHNVMSTDPKKWLGMNGRLFTIKMLDSTIIKTNDLWCQGTIPVYYRDKLKDNAEFVNDKN